MKLQERKNEYDVGPVETYWAPSNKMSNPNSPIWSKRSVESVSDHLVTELMKVRSERIKEISYEGLSRRDWGAFLLSWFDEIHLDYNSYKINTMKKKALEY